MQHPFGAIRRAAASMLALFVLIGAHALAAPPQPPQNLTATVHQPGSGNSDYVLLAWQKSPGNETIDEYRIYIATQDTGAFSLHGSVGSRDTILADNITQYLVIPAGDYSFVVTAVNADGESAQSNRARVIFKSLPSIRFTTYKSYSDFATVGLEYRYDADAESSEGGEIRYELLVDRDSMLVGGEVKLDTKTGVLTWTPEKIGIQYVGIRAVLVGDERVNAVQRWVINARRCYNGDTKITGTVVDEDGKPVWNGMVNATIIDPATGKALGAAAGIIQNGKYLIDTADEGDYILFVQGDGFIAEYYQDAYVPGTAQRVTLECGKSVNADFVVHRIDPIRSFSVTGVVQTKETGVPVASIVTFIGFEKGVPYSARWDRRRIHQAWASDSTGLAGMFEIQLPDNYTYVAYASPVEGYQGTYDYRELVPQYWNNVTNPAAATEITESSRIFFALPKRTVYNNGFSGTVHDSAGIGISATVVAFRVSTFGQADETAVSVNADPSGNYEFKSLEPGEYVVQATPHTESAVVGYYREGARAALSWRDATVVTVTDQVLSGRFDINLHGKGANRGSMRIKGRIVGNPNRTIRTGGSLLGEVPVAGATVIALDAQGQVSAYTSSDHEGRFELVGLGTGSYRITADKVGFSPFSASETLESDKETTVDIGLKADASSAAPVDVIASAVAATVSPNPAVSDATIRFTAAGKRSTITMSTSTGVRIFSKEIATTEGTNTLPIDLKGLPSGLYLVTVSSGSSVATVPVTVVR